MTTESIPEENVKKTLTYSVITIIVTPFIALIGLSFSYITTTGIYVAVFSFGLMAMGITSLIFYFINPEISYGMFVSKKKAKTFSFSKKTLKYIKIGQRITMGIFIATLCFLLFFFIIIINTIIP
jgi:hypothetical protein